MVHTPGCSNVAVTPLTVHTDGVVEFKATGRPDVEVAVKITEVLSIV